MHYQTNGLSLHRPFFIITENFSSKLLNILMVWKLINTLKSQFEKISFTQIVNKGTLKFNYSLSTNSFDKHAIM